MMKKEVNYYRDDRFIVSVSDERGGGHQGDEREEGPIFLRKITGN